MKNISNQQGSANLISVLIVAIVALFGAKFMLDRGLKLSANISTEISSHKAKTSMQKIMASASFMVANNLVICKEGGFSRGKICDWHIGPSNASFDQGSFGINKIKFIEGGKLRLLINPNKLKYKRAKNFKLDRVHLTFELEDSRQSEELQETVGERPMGLDEVDRDFSFVKVTGYIKYTQKKREEEYRTVSYLRRPIAVVTTQVTSDPICSSRCASSISNNPNPSCRGPQSIEGSSTVDISVTSINNGPGVLYALTYEKQVCYGAFCDSNSSQKNAVKVPITYVVEPQSSITWTDQVACRSFIQTTSNRNATRAPQHTTQAGSVQYVLDGRDTSVSNLEPFRVNSSKDIAKGGFPGLINLIYVEPTH